MVYCTAFSDLHSTSINIFSAHCNRMLAGFLPLNYNKKPGALKGERPAIFIDYASDQFAFWAFLAAFWAFLKSL